MLFNSIEYLIFLPIVFIIYWMLRKSLRLQNLFVVIVSYIFYGWWDWRFLLLIAFTSACSFYSGILVEKEQQASRNKRAKLYVAINVIINLVILGVFKYFNFFSENLYKLFELFGAELDSVTLNILLPVGISFYTFQALSYSIDVYRGSIKPTHDIVNLFAYVSFFPQLVAGPIERATNLLPQFERERKFDYDTAVDGCRQMLWGFFKKVIIADSCAIGANNIFGAYEEVGSGMLILGGVLFTLQIYGDFSGYSDIAIGCSKLFGIKLMRNFNVPYFARDIAEYWRRWHISLTTWFRDYLYIPLGGSRGSKAMVIRNTFIIFLVSGFWHGANWTYIAWGVYHALLFLPMLLMGKNRTYCGEIAENRVLPSLKEFGGMIVTFSLVVIGFIIFRSETIGDAWSYIYGIFSEPWGSEYKVTEFLPLAKLRVLAYALPIMIVVEWSSRMCSHPFEFNMNSLLRYRVVRWTIYYAMVLYILYNATGEAQSFIYFQF